MREFARRTFQIENVVFVEFGDRGKSYLTHDEQDWIAALAVWSSSMVDSKQLRAALASAPAPAPKPDADLIFGSAVALVRRSSTEDWCQAPRIALERS
jgi:hypothetical protein